MKLFLLLATLVPVCYIVAQESCLVEEDGRLRLTGLGSLSAGLVEICHNEIWGAVCVDTSEAAWKEKNAQVTCMQLDYSGALNSLLQRTAPSLPTGTPFHYSNVRCYGNESRLVDCPLSIQSECNQNRAAGIVCRETMSLYDVRLVGDVDNGQGAVEVYSRTGWVKVCPDISVWGDSQANAVCVQLGYDSGTAASYNLSTSDNLRMTLNADCSAEEVYTFSDCTITVTATGCSANPDMFAGVVCSSSALPEGSVRLFGASGPGEDVTEGRVEVIYDGKWGTICEDTFWSLNDGETTCQELGIDIESIIQVSVNPRGEYGGGSSNKPVWLGRLNCDSRSTDLNSCDRLDQYIGYTTFCEGRGIISDDDAAVNCNNTFGAATSLVPSTFSLMIITITVTLHSIINIS